MSQGFRRSIVHAVCFALGGHRFEPTSWREGPQAETWQRDFACRCCGKPHLTQFARGAYRPLDVFSGSGTP